MQRQTPRFVLSAVVATAIAAFFALRSGRAEDAFLPGILYSAAWGAGALVSVVVRWPLVGFVVGAGDPSMADDPFAWRRDRGLVRLCQRLTLVLVGLYALRRRGHAAAVPRRRGDRCWASPRSCWAGRSTSVRSPSWG